MAQESSFWHWYARVNDDVRTELIDRMWFDKQTRDHSFEKNMETFSKREKDTTTLSDPSVRTTDPHVPEALEGIGARGSDDFNAENVKSVMEEFYGRNRPVDERTRADLDRERAEATERFFHRRDLEPER